MTRETTRYVEDGPPADVAGPGDEPTVTVEHAGALLGISRGSAYAAAAAGDIPVIRVGRRLLVPTAALRKMLALDDGGGAAA